MSPRDLAQVTSQQPTDAAGETPFVGRESELAQGRAALHAARSGRGKLLLLLGEAGSGKTRTVEELVARSGPRRVLWSACHEGDGAPPYWPWVQIVRALVVSLQPDVLREVLEPDAVPLAELVPELHERLPGLGPAPPEDEASARFRLFDALTRSLLRASEREPLVIVLDDLHWADTPSLLMLRFLARELPRAAILVVATCREVELPQGHPLSDTLGDLRRGGATRRVRLAGLSVGEVARLISLASGSAPAPSLVSAVHRRTQGNPLFVEETIRLLAREGRLDDPPDTDVPLPVPHSVREVIGGQLSRLSEPCQAVLQIAAVLRDELSLEILERVAELPADALASALEEARGAGILRVDSGPARYRFGHALIRETLYDELPPHRRAALHGRVADSLEAYAGADHEPWLGALANHFTAALVEGGDAAKALQYLRRAAERARRLSAFEDGIAYCERALDVLGRQSEPDRALQLELLLELSGSQNAGSGIGDGLGSAQRALELARSLGDSRGVARAAVALARSIRLGAGPAPPEVDDLLRRAAEDLPESCARERAAILLEHVMLRQAGPGADQSVADAAQAERIARELGDLPLLARALFWKGLLSRRAAVASQAGSEGLRIGWELGDLNVQGAAYQVLMKAAFLRADRSELERLLGASRELATRGSNVGRIWNCRRIEAGLLLLSADWSSAERVSHETLQLGSRVSEVFARALQVNYDTLLALARGHGLDAIRKLRAMPQGPHVRSMLAAFCTWEGDVAEASAIAGELAADDFEAIPQDLNEPTLLSYLAEATSRSGRRDLGESLDRRLAAVECEMCFEGPFAPPVSHARGLLAWLLGRPGPAADHFERALEYTARLGARFWHAYTQCHYAALLRDGEPGSDTARGETLIRSALAFGRETGTPWIVRQARDAERSFRVEEASASADVEDNRFLREGEYWRVHYAGRSVRLRDMKGLRDLARLLQNVGREIHVAELVAEADPPSGDAIAAPRRALETGRARALRPAPDLSAIDARAQVAYRARIEELRSELAEAEGWNDSSRSGQLRQELDFLAAELSARVGLGRRRPDAKDPVERARKAVAMRIRYAVRKMARHHPELARHVEQSVRTGLYCCYAPTPPVRWRV